MGYYFLDMQRVAKIGFFSLSLDLSFFLVIKNRGNFFYFMPSSVVSTGARTVYTVIYHHNRCSNAMEFFYILDECHIPISHSYCCDSSQYKSYYNT